MYGFTCLHYGPIQPRIRIAIVNIRHSLCQCSQAIAGVRVHFVTCGPIQAGSGSDRQYLVSRFAQCSRQRAGIFTSLHTAPFRHGSGATSYSSRSLCQCSQRNCRYEIHRLHTTAHSGGLAHSSSILSRSLCQCSLPAIAGKSSLRLTHGPFWQVRRPRQSYLAVVPV